VGSKDKPERGKPGEICGPEPQGQIFLIRNLITLVKTIAIFVLVFCPLCSGLSMANGGVMPAVSMLLAQQQELSGDEAARLVQRQTRGKVLKVSNSGSSFRVRVLLPNGVVRVFTVDKVTGNIR